MEILAPCGSPGHIKAAVYAGADAVYLGGYHFSARRNATNFTLEDMRDAARFCRGFGVKLYVTVNILTRDGEFDEMRSYLRELARIAPDALIVQDIGVARLSRAMLPDMPLHASTQMSVHTPEGVRFCEKSGFSRVVIARECDRDALSSIIKASRIGIEVFVHGALCVSVSGQCGLSAVIGGRSGNRGLCAQPCRMDFVAGKRNYALSLKDLSLVREIPLLEKMGVSALKIEGRMKRPEYVAAAIRACRASLAGETVKLDGLRAVFSRDGFTQGYFYGKHDGMNGIRRAEDISETAAILPRLSELSRTPDRRVPVDICFVMKRGEESTLTISDGTHTVSVAGSVPSVALTRETTTEIAERLLSRMGNTPFIASDIQLNIHRGLTLQASQINAMRREACEKLLERRVERPTYSVEEAGSIIQERTSPNAEPYLRVHCVTIMQAYAVQDTASQIVLSLDNAEVAVDIGDKIIVEPDRYIEDEQHLKHRLAALRERGAQRLLCTNPAHAVIGRSLGYILHGGSGLNVFNSESVSNWSDYGFCDLTASVELRLSECLALKGGIPVGLVAYGKLPLILLRRCPFERDCENCPGVLSDRTGRRFPVRCESGRRELLNADTLWMADKLSQLRGIPFLSILLHDESPEQALAVVLAYTKGGAPPANYTRGLLKRGVE